MPRSCSSRSSLRMGRPLADGTWARLRMCSGVDSVIGGWSWVRKSSGVSPFEGVDDEAGQGLRVEVGRLLGHDVTLAGDGGDRGDRRRFEEESGVDAVTCRID